MTHHIAITGWTGFVGGGLLPLLQARGVASVLIDRATCLDATALAPRLRGADTLIHLIGLSHLTGAARPTFDAYKAVNVDVLADVLRACEKAHVRRVVMLSSLHVFMNDQLAGRLAPHMTPQPGDDYGRTKLMAEEIALAWSARTGVPAVILRPPLVYGAGARGNLAALVRLLDTPWPLPFGKADAPRAMVGLTNLADAIDFCARRGQVAAGCYMVQDPQPRSLAQLMRAIRRELGRSPRLLDVPVAPMRRALALAGRQRLANQLFGELTVADNTLEAAGWHAPSNGDSDVAGMVRHYLDNKPE